MADTIDYTNGPEDIAEPQTGAILDLTIEMYDGSDISVKALLVELSYYEDIYSFAVSGYLSLKDAAGIIEGLQLTGKENIKIRFANDLNNPGSERTYRLYSIPKRNPVGNLSSEIIKLYFCSEELILSEQTKVTRSYVGQPINSIIYDILDNDLGISGSLKSFNSDSTYGKYDFNIPTIKPFEAISWLSTYALPSIDGGADMLFYETIRGFQFKSLSNLYQQEKIATYRYDQKNVPNQTLRDNEYSVLDFEFVKTFDSLDDASAGTFANRLISIDPITRTKKVTDYDYDEYKSRPKMNPGDVLSTSTNRLGKKQNQSYTGALKLAVSNSEQKIKIPEAYNGSVAEDIFIEKFIPNRTSQISLANYTSLKLRIPGNFLLCAGDTIDFNLLSLNVQDDGSRELDKFYSGKYLITAVRHIMQGQDVYQCVLEISKESTPQQVASGY
jgi:hypothetical protein